MMKTFYREILAHLVWLALAAALVAPRAVQAGAEEQFDVLQAGTHTYTNVTVTTKAKKYIFIMHSTGMATVPLSDLSQEIKDKLGYKPEEKPKPTTTEATAAWAKQTMGRVEVPPQVREFQKQMEDRIGIHSAEEAREWASGHLKVISIATAAALVLYLLLCNCCRLICKKAGAEPGVLVWLPLLQVFPMLRAARMSPLWFLAFVLVVPAILAHIVWSVKIAKARDKSGWFGIWLILPVTAPFAFLYLAFSNGREKKPERRGIRVMSFETI